MQKRLNVIAVVCLVVVGVGMALASLFVAVEHNKMREIEQPITESNPHLIAYTLAMRDFLEICEKMVADENMTHSEMVRLWVAADKAREKIPRNEYFGTNEQYMAYDLVKVYLKNAYDNRCGYEIALKEGDEYHTKTSREFDLKWLEMSRDAIERLQQDSFTGEMRP